MDIVSSSGIIRRYILLDDIVASSRLMEDFPLEFNALLDRHNQLILTTCGEFGGEIFKNTGDGYYVFFESFNKCVAFAHSLAVQFAQFPDVGENEKFQVGMSIHAGDIRPSVTQYFGPALNRASRLCAICHPGQILISGEAVPDKPELPGEMTLTDLGLHHLRDLGQPEHLFQLYSDELPQTEFPALKTLSSRPNNLFEQPNTFIGRGSELIELGGLIAENRLVSIIAPGGYGKSRLSAQLCASLLDSFERGVYFVELAPLRDHTDITLALASATGFQFSGSRDPKEQLIDFLRNKEMLLCFDNFEHVMEGAPFIANILKHAPGIKVLVTSREPLRVAGEKIFHLEPLPMEAELPDALMLFADRATLVSPTFTLDVLLVQEICNLLSGIPLAIELAAAWMDSFTLPELLEELGEQLELTARLSDTPDRHKSLRASLDWSWKLLDEDHRKMLMAMSTFHGGCFADAASEVLQMKGMQLRTGLARLIDKSWLYTRDVQGKTRFYMRDAASTEYALEKLRATRVDGATSLYEQAAGAHARYFSALMAIEGERLLGQGQPESLQRIEQELQNIYEALDTLFNRMNKDASSELVVDAILSIVRWLWGYLEMTSAYRELLERCQMVKDFGWQNGTQQRILFWALLGCSRGHWRLGDNEAAYSNASDASVLAQALANQDVVAASLNNLGMVEYVQGNYDTARSLYTESVAIMRDIGDLYGVGRSLSNLGLVENIQGNFDKAQELLSESLSCFREVGNLGGISSSLNNLGIVQYLQGNYDASRELHNESLAICREVGDRNGIARSLNNLGSVECIPGNFELARDLYTESLAIKREIGDRNGIASNLCSLGIAEFKLGNYAATGELYAESLADFIQIGDRSRICIGIALIGCLQVVNEPTTEGAKFLYGASYQVAKLGIQGEPIEREMLEQGLATIEHPETGLPPDEREQLKFQAESMSLDKLAQYTLAALKKG